MDRPADVKPTVWIPTCSKYCGWVAVRFASCKIVEDVKPDCCGIIYVNKNMTNAITAITNPYIFLMFIPPWIILLYSYFTICN